MSELSRLRGSERYEVRSDERSPTQTTPAKPYPNNPHEALPKQRPRSPARTKPRKAKLCVEEEEQPGVPARLAAWGGAKRGEESPTREAQRGF